MLCEKENAFTTYLSLIATTKQGFAAGLCRTVQEREQDYSKARARIFGMQPGPEGAMPIQDTRNADDGTRNMNGARAPAMGVPAAGRGRGVGGRGDQGKKAVFRNREQDLQDPDYRRGYRYSTCRARLLFSLDCQMHVCSDVLCHCVPNLHLHCHDNGTARCQRHMAVCSTSVLNIFILWMLRSPPDSAILQQTFDTYQPSLTCQT